MQRRQQSCGRCLRSWLALHKHEVPGSNPAVGRFLLLLALLTA
jgi:hypothetical protein